MVLVIVAVGGKMGADTVMGIRKTVVCINVKRIAPATTADHVISNAPSINRQIRGDTGQTDCTTGCSRSRLCRSYSTSPDLQAYLGYGFGCTATGLNGADNEADTRRGRRGGRLRTVNFPLAAADHRLACQRQPVHPF